MHKDHLIFGAPFIEQDEIEEIVRTYNSGWVGTWPIVMVLQPTTPLRKASDIDDALEMMYNKNASAVVSVSKSNKQMYWHYTIKKKGYSNLFFH